MALDQHHSLTDAQASVYEEYTLTMATQSKRWCDAFQTWEDKCCSQFSKAFAKNEHKWCIHLYFIDLDDVENPIQSPIQFQSIQLQPKASNSQINTSADEQPIPSTSDLAVNAMFFATDLDPLLPGFIEALANMSSHDNESLTQAEEQEEALDMEE